MVRTAHWTHSVIRGVVGVLVCAFCLSASAAGLAPCDKPIRFAAGWFEDPELDNTKSSTEVTKIGTSAGAKGTQIGHVIVQTKLTVVPQESCAGLVVRLDYVKPVLRVASELPPQTCAYALVLTHEYTHVRIYRDMAERFRELEYPWPRGAASASVLSYAKLQLNRLTQAQVRFDSPEEYAKSQTMCGGEILRLVKTTPAPKSAKKSG